MKICKRNFLKPQKIEGIDLVSEVKILGITFDGFNSF